jgi:serine/threonine protein phosphatase PrpC
LFGVFDGHGGTEVANRVAKYLPHVFNFLLDTSTEPSTIDSIEKSFRVMDRLVSAAAHAEPFYSGCTATCALVTPTHVYLINAGDSRSLFMRGDELVAATIDHKPDDPKETERIKGADGIVRDRRVNGDLAVSRAFGDIGFKDKSDFTYD